jgi:hypothetical protein
MNDSYVNEILQKYKADPFGYIDSHTIHTGFIHFYVKKDEEVAGYSGKWRHIPGTKLYSLHREGNDKPVFSRSSGVVYSLRDDLEGRFVEAGEKVITIRYPLKKREIIEEMLRQVLSPFKAPERAKYFFSLDIQSRIEKFGHRSVEVKPGDEILTMSLMKRDTPIYYQGEPGIIHSIYFQPGITMEQEEPLLGICPAAKMPVIQKVITRVKAEWE